MAAHDPRARPYSIGQQQHVVARPPAVSSNAAAPSPYASGQWASPPPTMQFLPAQSAAGGLTSPPGTSPTSPPSGSWPPRLGQTAPPQARVELLAPRAAPHALTPLRAQPRPYEREREPPPLAVAVAEQAIVDPAMRQIVKKQAIVVGGHALDAAKYCGRQGAIVFQDYIQQGPQGVSVLCFIGGVATTILGAMGVCNVFGTMMDPFHYILNVYVLVFGLTTALVEADTDRIGIMMAPFHKLAEPVTRAQMWLHEECRLLTRLRGRGFFYLYQGTLLVTQCVFCMLFVCGLYLVAMGVVCILMSFGITPDIEGMMAESGAFGPGLKYSLVAEEAGSPHQAKLVEDAFQRAEGLFRQNKELLSGKACRELWALQKQATVGDCREDVPQGVFNGSAKEQWRLWTKLEGISQEEAKALFVERLQREGVHV